MNLVLNIYTDESLTELKRVAEADKLKIPYRVAISLIESLDGLDINNEAQLVKFLGANAGKVDKIIKATFAVGENELDCIDAGELGKVAMELYKWAVEKIKGISSKNVKTTA